MLSDDLATAADLAGVDLGAVDLGAVDLGGVDLGGVDLGGVDLGGVDLTGASDGPADGPAAGDLALHPRALAFTVAGYLVGKMPIDLAAGDLDGDGWPDVAVANSGGNSVSILLNQRDGTLKAAAPLTARQPYGVVIADFDGDKRLDVAVTDYGNNPNGLFYGGLVHVFLGNNDGTFQAARDSSTGGTGPSGLALIDANTDGRLDLVVADNDSSDVVLLTGKGDGTFNTPMHLGAALGPDQVSVADATGDGIADAVVTTASDISIYSGNGKTLAKASTVGQSNIFGRAVAGELDGDIWPDLVVAAAQNMIEAHYGSANGFGSAMPYTSTTPADVALADFDTDGKLDVATGTVGASVVQVLRGTGAGLGSPQPFSSGASPEKVIAADLNRDALPDLVSANLGDDSVSVLLNVSK